MDTFIPIKFNLAMNLAIPSLTNQVLFHFELCSATWSYRFPRLSCASPPFVSQDIHRPGQ